MLRRLAIPFLTVSFSRSRRERFRLWKCGPSDPWLVSRLGSGGQSTAVSASYFRHRPRRIFSSISAWREQRSGDIDDGADYLLPTQNLGLVVVPKGQRHVDLTITPLADEIRESSESVKLTLQPTSLPTLNDYRLGRRVSATVWILD